MFPTQCKRTEKTEKQLLASMLPGEDPFDYPGVPDCLTPLREIWQKIVREKQRRILVELSIEYCATRFFAHGQGDPHLDMTRTYV